MIGEGTQRVINAIVSALEDKKAIDVKVIDLEGRTSLAGAFILATGNSDVHMSTLIRVADETLTKEGITPRIEGEYSTQWALIDGGDVIVHIFGVKAREFYSLERIWKAVEAERQG